MSLGLYIYEKLSTDSALTTLLGGTKIYPVQISEDVAFPALSYSVVSNDPKDTKDGPGGKDVTRVQIDVFAETYAKTESIAARVRELLDGDSGTLQGVVLEYSRQVGLTDFYNDEIEVYQKSIDFSMRHRIT